MGSLTPIEKQLFEENRLITDLIEKIINKIQEIDERVTKLEELSNGKK